MAKLDLHRFLEYKKIKDIRHLITEKQYEQIEIVFRFYDTTTIKNRLTNIRDFILCGIDKNWVGRLRIIQHKIKNDILSEYSCKIRYGDMWEDKQSIMKNKVRMDKNKFIELYGDKIGEIKWVERNRKLVTYGLDAAIMRYGEIDGVLRWKNTLSKKILTMKNSKKIRKYRNGRTLSEYQNRYGVEIGYNKWQERNQRQAYRFSVNFYKEKFGEELGTIEWGNYCDNMVKTTKNSFISRYGKIDGINRYKEFVERISYTQKIEYYVERYGKDEGEIKYKEFLISKISNFKDKYSKISQDLFWSIYNLIQDKENCYFYELNYEYIFYVWNKNLNIISVDFKYKNKIIEFDGDFWHSSDKQKSIDNNRDEFLMEKGYNVLRVKESDFVSNKTGVINECIKFLSDD